MVCETVILYKGRIKTMSRKSVQKVFYRTELELISGQLQHLLNIFSDRLGSIDTNISSINASINLMSDKLNSIDSNVGSMSNKLSNINANIDSMSSRLSSIAT